VTRFRQPVGVLVGVLLLSCGPDLQSGKTSDGLYYEVSGRGEPVILVHGFSLDRRMWDAQETLLKSDFRVIRYDLRGHGLSDEWTEPFSAHTDMLSVFDAVDLPEAVVVGLSAGAEIAIDFAIAHPDRVSALVLASPGVRGYQPVGSFDWMTPVIEALQEREYEQATRAWTETPIMRIRSDPQADSIMRAIVMDNWRIWTYDPQLQQMPRPPALERLNEISAPTLIIVGELDLVDTQRVSDTLSVCLPNAALLTAPESGHLINLEAPVFFNEALFSFLETMHVTESEMASSC